MRPIIWHPGAVKELAALARGNRQMAERIRAAVEALAASTGKVPGEKALTGALTGWSRLRVGEYRVVFMVGATETLSVLAVTHRKESYR